MQADYRVVRRRRAVFLLDRVRAGRAGAAAHWFSKVHPMRPNPRR